MADAGDNAQPGVPPTLSDIVDRMVELLREVQLAEGEVTDEVAAELDALAPTLDQKAAAYSAVHRQLMGDAAANATLEDHYRRRRERAMRTSEQLKQRLYDAMQLLGVKKLGGPTGGATIQKSNAALVLLTNEVAVMQAGYRKVVESVDRQALRAAVEAGDERAAALAALEQSTHLRFR